MFCPKCGHLNLENVQSCQKCGARMPISGAAAAAAPAPQAAVATGIYAGFWKRFAALILDYFVVVILAALAGAVVGFVYGIASYGITSSRADENSAAILGAFTGLGAWWLYYAIMESSGKQATLGKMALGIKVVDLQGGRVSFARATGRHFGKLLSWLILMIGYMMAGFTSRKQALHDMMAGCLVINRNAPEEMIRQGAREAGMPAWAIVLVVLAVMVLPLGILAAIAIPAYQDFTERAKIVMAVQSGREATTAVETFYARNNRLPGDLKEAQAPAPDSRHVRSITMDPKSGAVTVVLADKSLERKSILFEPARESDGRIVWTCSSSDIKQRHLPHACRK